MANPGPAFHRRVVEAIGQGGLIALEMLLASANAFPPLKSAVGGTVAIINLVQVSVDCVHL